MSASKPGVIGLGMIGAGVASNLARAGLAPTVYDVVPDAVSRVAGVDSQAASPGDVAKSSDVVMVAVVNADQARDVLSGPKGILHSAHPGTVVVILSTLAISVINELSETCQACGVTLLDAGVTQAGDGKLVTMIGGPTEAVELVRPVLDAFSKHVYRCGALGTGMVTKLARNTITYSSWAVIHEAATIAHAGGVKLSVLLDVLENATTGGTAPTALLQGYATGANMAESQREFVSTLATKDLAAAREFAEANGVATPISDAVRPELAATFEGRFNAADVGA